MSDRLEAGHYYLGCGWCSAMPRETSLSGFLLLRVALAIVM
jgi:hypothetical protein